MPIIGYSRKFTAGKVLTYKGSAESSANASVYTFSSKDLGSAAADNRVHVAIATSQSFNGVSSITAGGQTLTVNRQELQNSGMVDIATGVVSAGGTGDIVVTFGGTQDRCSIDWWTSTGLSSNTAIDTDGANIGITGSSPPSITLDSVAGGFVIAIGFHQNDSTVAMGWTGATQRSVRSLEDGVKVVSAADGTTSSSTVLVRAEVAASSNNASPFAAATF